MGIGDIGWFGLCWSSRRARRGVRAVWAALLGLLGLALGGLSARATDLPAGFTELEYIESTKGGNQWILTDYSPSCTDTIEMKASFTATGANQGLFCSRGKEYKLSLTALLMKDGFIRMERDGGNQMSKFEPKMGIAHTLVFDYKNRTVSMDGAAAQAMDKLSAADFTPDSKLVLFATHTDGAKLNEWSTTSNYGAFELYSFKVTRADGTVALDLRPAMTATRVVGLYDTVSRTFFANTNPSMKTAFSTDQWGLDTPAEWSNQDETTRVLTLGQGAPYELTGEDVAALVDSGRDFVVRGTGTVSCKVDMSAFAKNTVLEAGILFSMGAANCFGAAKGTVTIRDGAAIRLDTNTASVMYNKKINFEGIGPDAKGAIQIEHDQWKAFQGPNNEVNEFYLTGDARIRQYKRVDYYRFIDTCGHNLQIVGKTNQAFGGSYVTNSASIPSTIVNNNGKILMLQSNGNPYRGSAENVFCLSNANYYTKWKVENGWTLAFHGDNSSVEAEVSVADGSSAGLDTCRFTGPVDVQGATRFTTRANRVMTLAGPLSGSGLITVDGGWLNLASANVTYSGEIAVKAKAEHEPGWRAGLALRTSTALPLSGLSLEDADLELAAAFSAALPPIAVGGADATSRVMGGYYVREPLACPRLTVADGATAEVASPLKVGEATVGAGATLRVIWSGLSLVGNPGLMGYTDYPSGMLWSFSKPKAEDFEANYTTYYPHGTDGVETSLQGAIRNHRLHGYIWNRSETDATWSFWANYNDRTFLWIDGEVVFSDVASYHSAEKRAKTITVKPGPHEIILIFTANQSSPGPGSWDNTRCAIGFDPQGRGMTSDVGKYYQPLKDPGDGSLLTIDAAAAGTVPSPTWSNIAFGAGATFDGNGYDWTVDSWTGCPAVENVASLTINEKFAVRDSDFIASGFRPCIVDGPVAFGEGSEVDIVLTAPLTREQKAALKGVTILSAQSITGKPRLSEAAKAARFTLDRQGKELKVSYGTSMVIMIR